MANKIQIRRGLKSKLPTLSSGELAYTTDTRETFVGTGSGNVNMGGSHWYTGTAMSGTSTTTGYYSYSACPEVKLGDIYLNTTYGYVYECTTAGSGTTAKWTYKGSIRGATGAKGATGSTGATGATGAAGTRGSVWNSGTAMSGTSTTTGAYSYSGASNALVGDYYLNTTYGYVYRCTTAGSGTTAKWTYQGCIKGATGATGATGANGKGFSADSIGAILMACGAYTKYTSTEKNSMIDTLGNIIGSKTLSLGFNDYGDMQIESPPLNTLTYVYFQEDDSTLTTPVSSFVDYFNPDYWWTVFNQNGEEITLQCSQNAIMKFTSEPNPGGGYKCYKIL